MPPLLYRSKRVARAFVAGVCNSGEAATSGIYCCPMIVWLNGGFGAGKSTLAEALSARVPGAVVYDPEDVGLMLWKWLEPGDDFQDLASWRELVVEIAASLLKHHTDTLIVPMSLIKDSYRDEILGGLVDRGLDVLHVFLEADAEVLRARLDARDSPAEHLQGNHTAREWAFSRVDAAVIAAGRQPPGTLMLRSDDLSPSALTEAVLAAVESRSGKRPC